MLGAGPPNLSRQTISEAFFGRRRGGGGCKKLNEMERIETRMAEVRNLAHSICRDLRPQALNRMTLNSESYNPNQAHHS